MASSELAEILARRRRAIESEVGDETQVQNGHLTSSEAEVSVQARASSFKTGRISPPPPAPLPRTKSLESRPFFEEKGPPTARRPRSAQKVVQEVAAGASEHPDFQRQRTPEINKRKSVSEMTSHFEGLLAPTQEQQGGDSIPFSNLSWLLTLSISIFRLGFTKLLKIESLVFCPSLFYPADLK